VVLSGWPLVWLYNKILYFQIISKGQIVQESSVISNGTSATVVFPVTQLMAPRARLLAYYIRSDSEVVANVIDFAVAGLLQNNVCFSAPNRISEKMC